MQSETLFIFTQHVLETDRPRERPRTSVDMAAFLGPIPHNVLLITHWTHREAELG